MVNLVNSVLEVFMPRDMYRADCINIQDFRMLCNCYARPLKGLHEVSVQTALFSGIHLDAMNLRRIEMPLPAMKTAKRCTAKAKSTGQQCQNPVKGCTGRVCRLHGWRSPETVRSGEAHPNYRHGQDTKAARDASRDATSMLKQVKKILKKVGFS